MDVAKSQQGRGHGNLSGGRKNGARFTGPVAPAQASKRRWKKGAQIFDRFQPDFSPDLRYDLLVVRGRSSNRRLKSRQETKDV